MDIQELHSRMHGFNKLSGESISFTLGMEDKGEILYYKRSRQPCYGEMRTYKRTPDDRKPSDLHDPFPDGTPIAVGINTQYMRNDFLLNWFLTGESSPYRNLWKDRLELTKEGDKIVGFVLTDTMFNPDYLIQGLVHLRTLSESYVNWKHWAEQGVDPWYLFILSHQTSLHGSTMTIEGKVNCYPYSLPSLLSFKNIKNGTPDLEKDFYFYNRAPYHRKGLENIWRGEDHLFNETEIKELNSKTLSIQEVKEKILPVIDRLAEG